MSDTEVKMEDEEMEEMPTADREGEEEQEGLEERAESVDEEPPLESTQLGNAIDSLMMHWCQLLTNVSVRAPVPPPSTLGHVKEVAEVCSKHFRDACVDVTNEFYRLGSQWEIQDFDEQYKIEERDLDAAILRQNALIKKAREEILRRTEHYDKHYPNASKHYTT